jgi:hypothetical protein
MVNEELSGNGSARTQPAEPEEAMGELGLDAVNVSTSGVRYLKANRATVERSAVQTLHAGESEIENSMVLIAAGEEVELEDSVAGVVVAREAEVEESKVFFLAAPVVKGDVRAVVDLRSMFAFGAGFAAMGFLLNAAGQLLRNRR